MIISKKSANRHSMSKKHSINGDDAALFHTVVAGIRPLSQDKVTHRPARLTRQVAPQKVLQEQIDASFYFSDEFQPNLSSDGPTHYVRPDVSHFELKQLRRGDYTPEMFLDLHGLTQLQAKQELGALIAACRREHLCCACVMHGHGKHVLKQQTPLWLAQHPDIRAFYQAPREWGGDAALLVLIDVDEREVPHL
ncbi:endonuclease SmrB [Edwardsiella ictaluri]|uniref:Ribosome rescue factor SmrB n=2 Tax=Edwardsiella ictaluri TaxID=67780 RepID=C5BAF4_EDWI9|nr:Smr domain protein [Edwardsiella ictaluri 93-146]BEI03190.1 endonuclease SmrB [Edwardsiella ictaluri]BEI06651.1 endonuclease SmrB [Edwardsiella ictaluri]BEI17067.1 endonuclease SmrB [Edwardsiella ictaluri]